MTRITKKTRAAIDAELAKMKKNEEAAGLWCKCGHSSPTHDVGFTCQSVACKCLNFRPSHQWVIDEVEDAYLHLTIRVADGTPNGNIDDEPIATVYNANHAKLIVNAVNSRPLVKGLVEALRYFEQFIQEWAEDNQHSELVNSKEMIAARSALHNYEAIAG